MIFYINKNTKIIVGRNNQQATILLNVDFHTIGQVAFSFIDDKNKIQNIDDTQKYYLAGKKDEIIFLSNTYTIKDNIITFDVNTYTEPFLSEINKRNTEIEIELGYNTNGIQNVLLRDYAFAQPRVYIEGLNPEKIDLGDYYTKSEVDSLFNGINIPTKLSELTNDAGFITANNIPAETDPVYKADKPNLALKTDLTNMVKLEYITTTGTPYFSSDKFIDFSGKAVTNLNLALAVGLKNAAILFLTGDTITYTITNKDNYKVNKAFELEPNSYYLMAIDGKVVLWTKVEEYA